SEFILHIVVPLLFVEKYCDERSKLTGRSQSRNRRRPGWRTRVFVGIQPRLRYLSGSAARSAPGAEAPENQFGFTENPLAERLGGRVRHVVPLHVFHVAAAVADEVVMSFTFGVESRGAAFHGNFTHQSCMDQIAQIVVSCGA